MRKLYHNDIFTVILLKVLYSTWVMRFRAHLLNGTLLSNHQVFEQILIKPTFVFIVLQNRSANPQTFLKVWLILHNIL